MTINLDLWHNAGYVLGILTEAMPVGEVLLTRTWQGWSFQFNAKIRNEWFGAQLILTSRDLMDRSRCESMATVTACKWNEQVRVRNVDP